MAALTEPSVETSTPSVDVKEGSTEQIHAENLENQKASQEESKKFVEAPIPKFNPWMVNRNQTTGGGLSKGSSRHQTHGKATKKRHSLAFNLCGSGIGEHTCVMTAAHFSLSTFISPSSHLYSDYPSLQFL